MWVDLRFVLWRACVEFFKMSAILLVLVALVLGGYLLGRRDARQVERVAQFNEAWEFLHPDGGAGR